MFLHSSEKNINNWNNLANTKVKYEHNVIDE